MRPRQHRPESRAPENRQVTSLPGLDASDADAFSSDSDALHLAVVDSLAPVPQEAELATGPSQVGALGASVATLHAHTVVDIQCGECDNGRETAPGRVAELQAVTLNDSVLAEREQGILSINRTVRHTTSLPASSACSE